MASKSRVTILVKAYPQPSKSHSETVCCAGIDEFGNWKRLFPIRFRQLSNDQAFKRWSIVDFKYGPPRTDTRKESCRVHEESIDIVGTVTREAEKQKIVENALVSSEKEAIAAGASLALIRPNNVRLKHKLRTISELETAKEAFALQARQTTMFDKVLDQIEPCPYEFSVSYDDAGGPHTKTCGDWETYAAFFNLEKKYGAQKAIQHLETEYCETYVNKGLVFALGNMQRRPQTWQLLSIFPSAPTSQLALNI